MKVLVTGSNGFLGTALVERLIAHGVSDIRCLVRSGSSRSRLEAVKSANPQVSIELFTGSLNSPEGISRLLMVLEWFTIWRTGMRGTAADLFLSSVVTSNNLLKALASRPEIKVVLVSSFGVYGTAALPKGAVVNEQTPLETAPEKRDLYSYAKWRQENLFWERRAEQKFPLVVLRPGVIYGPNGGGISSRVGLNLFGVFLHLGGRNSLPLSYVDNCAEAIVVAGQSPDSDGHIYNVHDDELPTSGAFLKAYRKSVKKVRVLRVPYWALMMVSKRVERYHIRSKGQLPAIFTPYKTATSWKGCRFDNGKLKSIGWKQIVPTSDGVRKTFEYMKSNPT